MLNDFEHERIYVYAFYAAGQSVLLCFISMKKERIFFAHSEIALMRNG